MEQFSEPDDLVLEGFEREFAKNITEMERLQGQIDELWIKTFAIFDRHGLVNLPARFVAKDGMVLSRVVASVGGGFDEDGTKAAILAHYAAAGKKLKWSAATTTRLQAEALDAVTDAKTVRVLNQDKLAGMIAAGTLPADVVKQQPQSKQFRRVRRAATKEDKQFLEIQAIENKNARKGKSA